MYPDTDLPPKKITKERLGEIRKWLPEQFWKRQEWYTQLGIPKDTIEELSISRYADLFKKAVIEWKVNPTTAAVFLIQYPKRLKKKACMIECLPAFGGVEGMLEGILKSYTEGKIPNDALLSVLKTSVELGVFTDEVIQFPINEKELDEEITNAKIDIAKIKIKSSENFPEILMGILMKKLRGKVSAKIVAEKVGFLGKGRSNV
jgi:glutamyl-tRNA(Gln) amidotransferase subunit E